MSWRGEPTTLDLLLASDWSQCTVDEIAEQINRSPKTVSTALSRYYKDTGEEIPYRKSTRGRKLSQYPTVVEQLLDNDWSDLPASEIAWVLGVRRQSVVTAMQEYKKRTGKEIPHAPEPRRRRDDE